jgi:hypothetical protein
MSSSGSLDLIKNKINFYKSYFNKNNFFKKSSKNGYFYQLKNLNEIKISIVSEPEFIYVLMCPF